MLEILYIFIYLFIYLFVCLFIDLFTYTYGECQSCRRLCRDNGKENGSYDLRISPPRVGSLDEVLRFSVFPSQACFLQDPCNWG